MTLQEATDVLVVLIREHRQWAAPVAFVLAFGESMAFVSLVLPFWGMLVAVGAVAGAGGLDFALVWTAASVGAALGDWVSYWLGYHYHDQIARMWPLSRHPDLLPRGHAFFEKYGAWAIVLGRFSGPFRASVPIVAGATQMSRTTFQVANWTSAFLWAFVLMAFGDGVGRLFGHLNGWFGG
jgi:membrane protein DedA with SNARE-associated domain